MAFFFVHETRRAILCPVSKRVKQHKGCPVIVRFSGLLLVFSGDSTIIQQFQVLGELLQLRNDFHPVTGPNAERLQVLQAGIQQSHKSSSLALHTR